MFVPVLRSVHFTFSPFFPFVFSLLLSWHKLCALCFPIGVIRELWEESGTTVTVAAIPHLCLRGPPSCSSRTVAEEPSDKEASLTGTSVHLVALLLWERSRQADKGERNKVTHLETRWALEMWGQQCRRKQKYMRAAEGKGGLLKFWILGLIVYQHPVHPWPSAETRSLFTSFCLAPE